MASQLYPSIRQKLLTAQFNWTTGVVRGVLLPASYLPSFTDVYLSSIPAGTRVAVSEPVLGRTAIDGVAGSGAVEFLRVTDTRLVSKAVLFKDTGVPSTSELILFIDEDDLVTAPFQPIGLDYYIYPNQVVGGLFRV